MTTTIRHIALITGPTADPDTVSEQLEAALTSMLVRQPWDGHLHRSLGLRPRHERAAAWMVQIDFASTEQFDAYLASPAHQGFIELATEVGCRILSIQHPHQEDDK